MRRASENNSSLFAQKIRALLLFTLAFMASSHRCQAAEEKTPISVKAEIDKAFITIGDPAEYTVTIRRDPSVQILSTIPIPAADIFKIKKIDEFKREEKGKVTEGRRMTLTTFRLGEFILDPIQIQYRIGGGNPQTIETNRIFLTVKSVAAGEMKTDIRGIKSVLSIPRRFFVFLVSCLSALAASLVGFWLYRRFVKPRAVSAPPEALLTPEEEAVLYLNQLFESDLLKKGKVKEYYLRLSEILRIYFEKRFEILAVESTTYEIVRLLKRKEIGGSLLDKIEEVLEAADLAKFAKWKPEPTKILELNQKSRQIVEEARPKEVGSGI
jgi:hypothetical protein